MVLEAVRSVARHARTGSRNGARYNPPRPCLEEDPIALRVMKFGGSSVADADKIKNVARRIAEAKEGGDEVVAVLSARGKTTDGLVAMAQEISDQPDPREMDMLLSTGERISCALMAMALQDLGHEEHRRHAMLAYRRFAFQDAP